MQEKKIKSIATYISTKYQTGIWRREIDRLIAEWERQTFTQLVLPSKNSDWDCCLDEIVEFYYKFAYIIAHYQKVLICYDDEELIKNLKHKNFIFKKIAHNDTWVRDFGPISIYKDKEVKLLDFKFNGWGLKYPANLDNLTSRKIFKIYKSYNFVLEGGSIDTNSEVILTTSKCLLEENRNYPLSKKEIEDFLKRELLVKKVYWLNHGAIEGDDTDSHIDTLARFINKDTIMYVFDEDNLELKKMKEELKKLPFNLIELPMPQKKYFQNRALPATYANFLFINDAIILPTYNDPNDKRVIEIFKSEIKDREIISLDASILIRQNGSIHCASKEHFANLLK